MSVQTPLWMTSGDGTTYLGQRVVRTEAQRLANAVFAVRAKRLPPMEGSLAASEQR